ncbi:amidase domain-containing protein [Heliophilum fasciatum]|uniref:Putative amidase-like protein n=1 Tax=Heliophilum fasciatum TaxID=35700 RepID=A0A4R2SBZ7_9FIRM|nr:amidase domain-containing protein [Heliophilum fasciatum]MCW2276844.1 hypothetical protein [Heliophilum fasciatum]TCP68695.1 putative amidase-like protein [Heliophilum fasciatum]
MYDRDAAVAYANRYYQNHNPAYPDFDDQPWEGGNCANFISQCLYAGGMPWITGPPSQYTSVKYWWCQPGATDRDGDKRITLTWKVALAFGLHWAKRAAKYTEEAPATVLLNFNLWSRRLDRGDVIQLTQANGNPYHTLILVQRSGSDWLLAAQTYDTNDRSLFSTLTAMAGTGQRVRFYQMG